MTDTEIRMKVRLTVLKLWCNVSAPHTTPPSPHNVSYLLASCVHTPPLPFLSLGFRVVSLHWLRVPYWEYPTTRAPVPPLTPLPQQPFTTTASVHPCMDAHVSECKSVRFVYIEHIITTLLGIIQSGNWKATRSNMETPVKLLWKLFFWNCPRNEFLLLGLKDRRTAEWVSHWLVDSDSE